MTYRLGVDTGGTFTDFILVDEEDWTYKVHKTPSTPENPAQSMTNGLDELSDLLGIDTPQLAAQLSLVVHGTTVATNAVLTGNGAKVGLITTKGFRDALQMRRGMREEVLNNKLAAPAPLVPRHRRLGITERSTFSGEELEPLADEEVYEAAHRLREEGVDAVAICFLHSYANASHERRAKKILSAELPHAYVTASHELLAQIRLYERVSSTVLNAYTGPLMDEYLGELVQRLGELGFTGDLLVMQSNGGLTSPSSARTRAAVTLLSGPAAVPVAGAVYAEAVGERSCLTVDMGGTSFDAALIPNGAPTMLRDGGWVNRHRIALPMLAIHTIGAGGGSIGWIDRSGFLRMGPQSAGAVPGPACYGHGGTLPTCTDANLTLGYLNPDNFLGGRMGLNVGAAEGAIEHDIAGPLGISVPEAAAAMFDVINVNMTAGIREVSVDRGVDPRDFLLVVAGGAGPVHAGVIAKELGIPKILVPRDSAVFAAAGMLLADVRQDAVRAIPSSLSDVDSSLFTGATEEMVADVHSRMLSEGFTPEEVRLSFGCDLRYEGQFHEISITAPAAELMAPNLDAIADRFNKEHERLYGWASPGAEIQLVNIRISGEGSRRKPLRSRITSDRGDSTTSALRGRRRAYLPFRGAFEPVNVFDGEALLAEAELEGPAIVELSTTTVFVPETYRASVTKHGDFVLSTEN
jgi:N-methylhydantoinase A